MCLIVAKLAGALSLRMRHSSSLKAVFRFDVAPVLGKNFASIYSSIGKSNAAIIHLATSNQNTANSKE